MQFITETFWRQFEVESCAIYLVEGNTDELVMQACIGREASEKGRLRLGQGITGIAALEKKPIQVTHMSRDPRTVVVKNQEQLYQSIVAVPLDDGDQVHGVFNLQSTIERHFSTGEMEVLIQAVKPIILSLVNTAQSDETRQRRTNELRAINELGQAINSGLGLDETLELIADRVTEVLHAKAAAIRFVVEDGTLALGTVIVKGGNGLDLQNEKRITQYVADAGEPILIDDVRTDWEPWNLGSSLVCIPLVLEDQVVGTLTLLGKILPAGTVRRVFSTDDLNLLFALSSQVAAKIEETRLTSRLHELVRNEKRQPAELRKLYNRSQVLLELISDGLVALDSRGLISEVNTIAKRIFGGVLF